MLLQPITVPFSKSTLKPSVYTLIVKPPVVFLAGSVVSTCKYSINRSKC